MSEGNARIAIKSKFDKAGTYNFDRRDTVDVVVGPATVTDAPVRALSGLTVFPNPFHSAVNIRLGTMASKGLRLAVYATNGRLVKDLSKEAGYGNVVRWNGEDVPPGIYILRLTTGDRESCRRLVFLK